MSITNFTVPFMSMPKELRELILAEDGDAVQREVSRPKYSPKIAKSARYHLEKLQDSPVSYERFRS